MIVACLSLSASCSRSAFSRRQLRAWLALSCARSDSISFFANATRSSAASMSQQHPALVVPLIASELKLAPRQVEGALALFDEGSTLPFIARYRKEATGGLDDTIEPWDARTGKGTGFKFTDYNGESLLATVKQALLAYRDQSSWQTLMRNGMAKDFSWKVSAREYVRVYERVRQLHAQPILV